MPRAIFRRVVELLWFGFVSVALAAEPSPDPVLPLGKQPSGTREAPDPTIAREGDWYYVFSTGAGISVRRSKNLVDWEMLQPVFSNAVPGWARAKIPNGPGGGLVWAPDILKFQNKYYLYYCVSTLGSQHSVIGLATAEALDPKNPKAGWRDEGLILESFPEKDPFNALDPSMCVDEEGNPWLVWGSYWKGIYLQRVVPSTGRLLEGAQRHHIASRATTATPQAGIEGATITRKNGFYYLFVSHDDFIRYNVKVGRSKSITGPYLDRQGRALMEGHGTPVLAPYGKYRGTGHNGLLIDQCPWFDVMVHHVLMPESRDLQVRPIFWSQDGWPLAGESLGPREPIQGQWFHQVGWRDIYRVQFGNNGELTAQNGAKGKWGLKEGNLTLRWPMPDGTEAVDECVVSPDGRTYVGRNAKDVDIRGWREQQQVSDGP
ncbi:MAG: arabinan endo-1,5-alpha-L-arabinosidase [Verrucomicrobiota bacterium]